MNKIGLLLFFQLGIGITSASQILVYKQIGFGVGLSFNAVKSELISPYTFKGNAAPLQLYFRSGKAISRHHLQLQYLSSSLTSISKGLITDEEGGCLQYAYHRRLTKTTSNLAVFGGAVVNAQGTQRTNLFNGSVGNNITGELLISFSPSLLAELHFKKDKASAQVWSPVLAFCYQRGYALGPEGGDMLSFGNFSGFEWRVSYDRHLSERWNVRLDYQFQFFRLTKFETLASLRNQITISLVFKIK
jgi:hypothetical protein